MVEYRIDIDNRELMQAMRRWERNMPGFTRMLLERFGAILAARSGEKSKEVLNVITGRLSTSMFARVPVADTLHVGAGSNVAYAGVHEFGFSGSQYVRPHKRSVVFGRATNPFMVPGFTRQANIPARPYVRPSIETFFMTGEAREVAEGVFAQHKRRYGFE